MCDVDGCCNEIKSTGFMECLGFSQCDWGGNACYELWKLAPCCGAPDAINCLLCWFNCFFCCPCVHCKLYATSLNQTYSVLPHCLCGCFCCPCVSIFTRYNLRHRAGARGNMIGDWMCMYCCGPCAQCQNLRSVDVGGWRYFPEFDIPEATVKSIMFII